MRSRFRLFLSDPEFYNSKDVDPAGTAKLPVLADLMLDAYRDTVDYEGEGIEEAKEEVASLLDGNYGPFLAEHSFVRWVDGILVSASLITSINGVPFLAFSMTRKGYQRQGHARALIAASAASLAMAGYDQLDLEVTNTNKPAIELYRSMGFHEVKISQGKDE